jgi:hypothetical protein
MKTLLLMMFFLLICPLAEAKDLQYFNPEVFGCSSSAPVKLFHEMKSDDIEPIIVQMDIKDGIFYAATITYPNEIKFEEARESLNKKYKKYETQYSPEVKVCNWRVEDKKFVISLAQEENFLQVLYISFQPKEVIFKHLLKSKGINLDKLISEEKGE